MAEEYDIECVCGFDNRVTSGMLGTTRECVNCGADLFVDPEQVRQVGAAPETLSRTELLNQEERHRATSVTGASKSADASPFTETPAPNAPASPFAEEGAAEYNPFAEAAPPPKRFDDIERPPSRLGYVEVPTVSSLDADIEGACSACGKKLRGHWDRVETPEGVVCYVCSNQATERIPERIRDDHSKGRESTEPEVLYPVDIDDEVKTPEGFFLGIDTQSEGFKRFVLILSVATLLIAFSVWLLDDSSPPPVPGMSSAAQSASTDAVEEVPRWVNGVILGWQILGAYIAAFITIYVVCDIGPGLPHDTFKMNALYFGYVLGILTVIEAVYFGVGWALSGIPFAGPIWWMLARALIGLYYIWAFIHFLEYRIRDFFFTLFIFGIVEGLVQAMSMFFYAGLANLVL